MKSENEQYPFIEKNLIGVALPLGAINAEAARGKSIWHASSTLYLWRSRTVKSPDLQFSHVDVPLVSSLVLSKKSGHEAYVQSVIKGGSYHFKVKIGRPQKEAPNGTKAKRLIIITCSARCQYLKIT